MVDDIGATEISPDPKGNIELVHFGDTAILFRGGDKNPFIVASGYDRKSGEWHGPAEYVNDLSRAWDLANPNIVEDATVKWTRSEVAEALEGFGIEACDESVNAVLASPELELTPELLGSASKQGGQEYIEQTINDLVTVGELDAPEEFKGQAEGLDEIAQRAEYACDLDEFDTIAFNMDR